MNTYSNRIQFTRDESQENKKQEVYAKIAQIISSVEPRRQEASKQTEVKFVGIEDAIKELMQLDRGVKP